jgi:hypothetical protein
MRSDIRFLPLLALAAACNGGSTESGVRQIPDSIRVTLDSPVENQAITDDTLRITATVTKGTGSFTYAFGIDGHDLPDTNVNSIKLFLGSPAGPHKASVTAKSTSSVAGSAEADFVIVRDSTIVKLPLDNSGNTLYCGTGTAKTDSAVVGLGFKQASSRTSSTQQYCGFVNNDSAQGAVYYGASAGAAYTYTSSTDNVADFSATVTGLGACVAARDITFYLQRSDDGGKTFPKVYSIKYDLLVLSGTSTVTHPTVLRGPGTGYTIRPKVVVKNRKCSDPAGSSVQISFVLKNNMDRQAAVTFAPPPVTITAGNP